MKILNDIDLIKKYVKKELQEDAIKKLESGYPVQYIIGNVDFYDCIIDVNESVLIPRFETEYLVQKTINLIKDKGFIKPKILDIGTGSGCIAIALKKNIDCDITAIDINNDAINLANKNAIKNNVDINYLCVDFDSYEPDEQFDIIISNPPYVPFNSVVDEKTKYEPQNAIFAKDNGLYFYKTILKKSKKLLKKKNIIAFEIGDKQGKKITELAQDYYPKSKIYFSTDYNGYDRYLFIINE